MTRKATATAANHQKRDRNDASRYCRTPVERTRIGRPDHDCLAFPYSIQRSCSNSIWIGLVRGPYSWAGWGVWGMTWPFQAEPTHEELPPLPHGVPLPTELTPEGARDFSTPLGVCYKSSPSSGIFSLNGPTMAVSSRSTATTSSTTKRSRAVNTKTKTLLLMEIVVAARAKIVTNRR